MKSYAQGVLSAKTDFLNLKRYCLRSVLLKKWKLLEVIKRCPKPCSTIPCIRENSFSPFDSEPLATLRFVISWHQKRMNLQNILQNIEHRVVYFARNFPRVIILFWCHESSKRRVANSTESNGLNRFSRMGGIVKQGLWHVFNTTSSSHFFNKTVRELYIRVMTSKKF